MKCEEVYLEELISNVTNEIARLPEGAVQVKQHGNGVQFFYRERPDVKNGVYMTTAERDKALALIQKRYLERVLAAAQQQKKAVTSFLKRYDPQALVHVLLSEGNLRQPFIRPIVRSDEQFVRAWEAVDYEGKPFHEESAVHYTRKRERVRSKSEVIIANTLAEANIPYRYEAPLKIDGRIIYPDFTILRMEDRQTVYWEHLGLMDDMDYRNRAFVRIRQYEKCGICPGDRLILTVETQRLPLNAVIVEQMIRHYLLPSH